MKKINKITFISAGIALGAAAIVTPTAILLAHPTRHIENGLINSVPTFNKESLKNIEGSQPTKEQTQEIVSTGFKVERVNTRSTEEQYKITIINNDQYGTVTFEDGTTEFIAAPGQTVNLKVQVKDEYKESHTIVNLEVFDQAEPHYSLGVIKVDENNYKFTMPEGGEEGKWFYQSGNIFAKITYGLKKLGKWEFNFESRHYVFNVTEDNFVFDDVANPELKMQKYPSGEFVVYRIQLNGHNIKIKNMTIPKNVQLEICDKYEELFDVKTTENSPVVGFAQDGVLDQQGAAGIWHGVRATEKTLSEFNWQLDDKVAHADASYDL